MKKSKLTSHRKITILLACLLCALIAWTACIATGADTFAANAGNFVPELEKVEAMENSRALSEEIAGEGFVMLKNDTIEGGSKALPVPQASGKTGVSIFGKQSLDNYFVFGGSVSAGTVAATGRIGLYESVADAGFKVNESLKTFFSTSARAGSYSRTGNHTATNAETTSAKIQADLDAEKGIVWEEGTGDSRVNYKDVAIIVIGRSGGENTDLWLNKTDASLGTNNPGTPFHGLQLSAAEKDLMKWIKTQGFGRTILLMNGISFEYSFIFEEEYGIDAAFWIGVPGRTGMNAIGKLLNGKVNPSGRLTGITYADFRADATWFSYSNNDHLTDRFGTAGDNYMYVGGIANTNRAPDTGRRSGYSAYNEGIYLGYRYYETIAADIAAGKYVYMNGEAEDGKLHKVDGTTPAKTDKVANANAWYDDKVVFPFGYGMSYTSFDWKLESQSPAQGAVVTADDKITLKVKVTNTGTAAGKDVVQLYHNAPYINNGIEKAHVVLSDYAKTSLLKPGESEVLSLSVKVRDMASYDWNDANKNGFKGYELDGGEYNIFVGKNSNNAWRNTDGIKAKYTVAAGGIKVTHSEYTKYEIKNQFDHSTGTGGASHLLQQMSRGDFIDTFPKVLAREDRQVTMDYINTLGFANQGFGKFKKENNYAEGKPYEATEMPNQAETPATGHEKDLIRLYDLVDVPKNDPLWDEFMDQITIDQLISFSRVGFFASYEIHELGIPRMVETDGPYGIVGNSSWNEVKTAYSNSNFGYYTSSAIVAATFNDELVERMGANKGEEGLLHGVHAIYAPGVNVFRSYFEGRNNEYYSEDGLLGGRMCAAEVKGMQSRGTVAFVKHFAVREEENENNAIRLMTEQALREVYLKQFQIAVEEGGALAMMASNNPIGETWFTAADYGLMTEVLRNEWGFEGVAVTDFAWPQLRHSDGITSAILGGCDKIMYHGAATGEMKLLNAHPTVVAPAAAARGWYVDKEDPTLVTAIRKAAKNQLFTASRSSAMMTYMGKDEIIAVGNFTEDVSSYWSRFDVTQSGSYQRSTEPSLTMVRTYTLAGDVPAGFAIDNNGILSGNAEAVGTGTHEFIVEVRINGFIHRTDTIIVNTFTAKDLVDKISDLESKLADLNDELVGLTSELADLKDQLAELKKQQSDLISDFEDEVDDLKGLLSGLEKQITDLQDLITSLKSQIDNKVDKDADGCGSILEPVTGMFLLLTIASVTLIFFKRKKSNEK